jgi:hypothetical protein
MPCHDLNATRELRAGCDQWLRPTPPYRRPSRVPPCFEHLLAISGGPAPSRGRRRLRRQGQRLTPDPCAPFWLAPTSSRAGLQLPQTLGQRAALWARQHRPRNPLTLALLVGHRSDRSDCQVGQARLIHHHCAGALRRCRCPFCHKLLHLSSTPFSVSRKPPTPLVIHSWGWSAGAAGYSAGAAAGRGSRSCGAEAAGRAAGAGALELKQ